MVSTTETARQCRLSCRLLLALALAVPASLVTKTSFSPLDVKLTLTNDAAEGTVKMPAREPLYVEYGSTVRAPSGARRQVIVSWNGARVTRIGIWPVIASRPTRSRRTFGPRSRILAAAPGVELTMFGSCTVTADLEQRVDERCRCRA